MKETTQNLLIDGHNTRDGTMFGLLTQCQRADYLKKYPLIRFSTLWEEEYVIFAVLNVSMNPKDERLVIFFTRPALSGDREFETYVAQLKTRSIRKTYVDVKPEDARADPMHLRG